jgi:hypothetical protein
MGRISGKAESALIVHEIMSVLRVGAAGQGYSAQGASWYLFGSVISSPEAAQDIDLLIVCASDEIAIRIRVGLPEIASRLPLHTLIMTHEEEAELDFIRGQKCVLIYPDCVKGCVFTA